VKTTEAKNHRLDPLTAAVHSVRIAAFSPCVMMGRVRSAIVVSRCCAKSLPSALLTFPKCPKAIEFPMFCVSYMSARSGRTQFFINPKVL